MSISKDFLIFLQGVYVPHVKLHVYYWWLAENFDLRVHLHLRFIRRELLQKTSELRTTNFSLSGFRRNLFSDSNSLEKRQVCVSLIF